MQVHTEYLTEKFDRSVCTGAMRHDGIMPANAAERWSISRYAQRVLRVISSMAAPTHVSAFHRSHCPQPPCDDLENLHALAEATGLLDDVQRALAN